MGKRFNHEQCISRETPLMSAQLHWYIRCILQKLLMYFVNFPKHPKTAIESAKCRVYRCVSMSSNRFA